MNKYCIACMLTLNVQMFYRHTSRIENFNSLVLKYAPKRVGFQ